MTQILKMGQNRAQQTPDLLPFHGSSAHWILANFATQARLGAAEELDTTGLPDHLWSLLGDLWVDDLSSGKARLIDGTRLIFDTPVPARLILRHMLGFLLRASDLPAPVIVETLFGTVIRFAPRRRGSREALRFAADSNGLLARIRNVGGAASASIVTIVDPDLFDRPECTAA